MNMKKIIMILMLCKLLFAEEEYHIDYYSGNKGTLIEFRTGLLDLSPTHIYASEFGDFTIAGDKRVQNVGEMGSTTYIYHRDKYDVVSKIGISSDCWFSEDVPSFFDAVIENDFHMSDGFWTDTISWADTSQYDIAFPIDQTTYKFVKKYTIELESLRDFWGTKVLYVQSKDGEWVKFRCVPSDVENRYILEFATTIYGTGKFPDVSTPVDIKPIKAIKIEGFNGVEEIQLYSSNGRLVHTFRSDYSNINNFLSKLGLSSGIYFLNAKNLSQKIFLNEKMNTSVMEK